MDLKCRGSVSGWLILAGFPIVHFYSYSSLKDIWRSSYNRFTMFEIFGQFWGTVIHQSIQHLKCYWSFKDIPGLFFQTEPHFRKSWKKINRKQPKMSNSKLCIKWGITEASRLPEGGVILTSGYFQQPMHSTLGFASNEMLLKP